MSRITAFFIFVATFGALYAAMCAVVHAAHWLWPRACRMASYVMMFLAVIAVGAGIWTRAGLRWLCAVVGWAL